MNVIIGPQELALTDKELLEAAVKWLTELYVHTNQIYIVELHRYESPELYHARGFLEAYDKLQQVKGTAHERKI